MDRRHTGHEMFSHYINYNVYVRGGQLTGGGATNEINFLKARVWFWEKFGPSCELGKYNQMYNISQTTDNPWDSPEWAWQTEHNLLRIYVREKALDFFMLANTA